MICNIFSCRRQIVLDEVFPAKISQILLDKLTMEIRKAVVEDCRTIAELALMAGEGIPAFFWEQSRRGDEDLLEIGARNASSETENFSYKNVHVASFDNDVAGMLLAYRLPNASEDDNLDDYPEFIRPLIELEQYVPGSFYINMLATYPKYRNKHVGTTLMSIVNKLAESANCKIISVEVFEQNQGAFRLYQRLGYNVVQQRDVVPHACHPYTGKILLLTKETVS